MTTTGRNSRAPSSTPNDRRSSSSTWLSVAGGALLVSLAYWTRGSDAPQVQQQHQQSGSYTQHRTAEMQQVVPPLALSQRLAPLQVDRSPPAMPLQLDAHAVATMLVAEVENMPSSATEHQLRRQLNSMPRRPRQRNELVQLVRWCADAIWFTFGVRPYRVQLYAVMRFLLAGIRDPSSASTERRGTLAQVRTGEGKSMISMMVAAAMALQDRRVHCMSSNVLLSQRDYEHAQDYLDLLRLSHASLSARSTGHILTSQQEQAQVLFGTPDAFQFYHLEQGLLLVLDPTGLPAKKLATDVVIVDEEDDLLLDGYISLPVVAGTPPQPLVTELQMRTIYHLGQHHSRNNAGDLNMHAFQSDVATNVVTASLSEERRMQLCRSYVTAQEYGLGRDYVVQPQSQYLDRLAGWEPNLDITCLRGGSVIIVRKDSTGELAPGHRWEHGIHEFIEIRHGLKVEAVTFEQARSAHACYLRQYETLIGMSGTVGSQSERAELRRVFEVSTFEVPRNRANQLYRRDDLFLAGSQADFQQAVANRALEDSRRGRPVLIICEDIASAKALARVLHQVVGRVWNGVKLITGEQFWYMRDGFERAGEPGRITVTTVVGGRGIDIKLTPQSKTNGGLHVILTFSPASQRVEEQCIGRAARQGEPGSAQIIAHLPEGFQPATWSQALKQARATSERDASVQRASHLEAARFSWTCQQLFFEAMAEYAALSFSKLAAMPADLRRRSRWRQEDQERLATFRYSWSELIDSVSLASSDDNRTPLKQADVLDRVHALVDDMRS